MNEGLIPRRYAKALYKYAQEHNCTQEVYLNAQRFEESYAAHPALAKALANPALSISDKKQLLITAAGSDAGNTILRFIDLVTQNHRETYFRAAMLAYQDIYRKENGIARVTIVTASEMSNEIVDRIKSLLKQQLNKELEYVYETDPSIIGGFILRVESMQLDASIQHELKKLRVKLLNK